MATRIYFEKFYFKDDFKYFLKLSSNEEIMLMNYGRIFSLEESQEYYSNMLQINRKHEDFGYFKVFDVGTNVFIGLGAIVINDDLTEVEIEYLLLPEYWGRRYGSEIVEVFLEKAEGTQNIQRITAITCPENIASKRILFKYGFESQRIFEIDDGTLAEIFSKKIVH